LDYLCYFNVNNYTFCYSILGRIVRVNDKVILYRQWVRDTYALQNTQRVIINNYLTTSNISNNVSVSTTTSSRASTVSSGSGSAESVSVNVNLFYSYVLFITNVKCIY